MNPIGIFGGTFDPIHFGHLRPAFELSQALKLAEVRFLPAGNPPHRQTTLASAEVRLAMVKAAVAGEKRFVVDDREVRRTGASYSVDTLTELRAEFPDRSLCLMLGMDAFLGLPELASLARHPRSCARGRLASPGLEGAREGAARRGDGGSGHRQHP